MKKYLKEYAKKILNYLKNNLKLIIYAIVISVIAWFSISLQIFPNITAHITDIPVTFTPTTYMIDENLQIADGFNEKVSVKIQGKRYEIGNLSTENFRAYLDLSYIYDAGEHTVNVVVEPVDDIECDILSTNLTVQVKVEKIISRELPVIANVDNVSIADGFQIEEDNIVTDPSSVIITGEEKLVNSIDRAVVTANYDGVIQTTSDVKGELSLYSKTNSKIENPDLSVNNDNFTITIPISKVKTLPLKLSFTNAPVGFDLSSLDYSIYPEQITIASPDNSIDAIDYIEIGEIPLSDLTFKNLQGVVQIPITLLDGYKNITGINTATITFSNMESYGKLEFTVLSDNFSIINAPAEYTITPITSQLNVTVIGPSDFLQEMTSDDIIATANLLGTRIEEGTKSVSVTFRIKGTNVKAWVTGDYKIDISASIPAEDSE